MVFASAVGQGIRTGSLRASSRSSNVAPWRLCRSNTRLFSSVSKPAFSSPRLLLSQRPSSFRTFSLWPGSKPSPPPSPVVDVPTAEEVLPSSTVIDPAAPTSADSTTPIDAAFATDSGFVSDSVAAAESLSDSLTQHLPAALQYGDLAAMGLAGWSPAGIIRWSFEIINVTTGMPWIWTIVAGTAFWRLVCVPLALKGLKSSARLQPHQAELAALQKYVKQASATGDREELTRASNAMRKFYKDRDISPFGGAVALLQLPVTLGLFFAVQKMCNFPVEQLKDSGLAYLPDLTATDPTFLLPALLFVSIQTQIAVGVRDINTKEQPQFGHLMNAFRILAIPGVYLMSGFPIGLLVSLFTTGILTTTQTLILRIPAARRSLGIPIPPAETRGRLPSMMSTLRYARDYLKGNMDMKMQVDEARRQAALRDMTKNSKRR